jgi:hypothetical protein
MLEGTGRIEDQKDSMTVPLKQIRLVKAMDLPEALVDIKILFHRLQCLPPTASYETGCRTSESKNDLG